MLMIKISHISPFLNLSHNSHVFVASFATSIVYLQLSRTTVFESMKGFVLTLRLITLRVTGSICALCIAQMSLKISSVIAVTPSWGIGQLGAVPWVAAGLHLRHDLAFFRETTTKTNDPSKRNIAVMGRRTWESIPLKYRPLKDRINVVLSSTMEPETILSDDPCVSLSGLVGNVHILRSFDHLLDWANQPEISQYVENIMVVGGSALFEESFFHPQFQTLYLTQVLSEFPCDTYLGSKMSTYLSEHQVELDRSVTQDNLEECGIQYR